MLMPESGISNLNHQPQAFLGGRIIIVADNRIQIPHLRESGIGKLTPLLTALERPIAEVDNSIYFNLTPGSRIINVQPALEQIEPLEVELYDQDDQIALAESYAGIELDIIDVFGRISHCEIHWSSIVDGVVLKQGDQAKYVPYGKTKEI